VSTISTDLQLAFPAPPLGKAPTIATVMARIATDPNLTGRKPKDLAWALRSVARAMGHTPSDMPANPRYLSKRLDGFSPVMAGLSADTWQNVLSLTRFALRHVGIIKVPARQAERFAPKWTALVASMGRSGDQIGLSRLARFCTAHGIDPESVNDSVFDAFLEDVTTNAVVRLPHKIHRRAAIIWNQMVQSRRNWPNQTVTVPSYSRTYFVGWDKFPPTLKADIDAHLEVLAGNDILAQLDVRPLKPRSIVARRHQLGAYGPVRNQPLFLGGCVVGSCNSTRRGIQRGGCSTPPFRHPRRRCPWDRDWGRVHNAPSDRYRSWWRRSDQQ
jgi:hypothetical protein